MSRRLAALILVAIFGLGIAVPVGVVLAQDNVWFDPPPRRLKRNVAPQQRPDKARGGFFQRLFGGRQFTDPPEFPGFLAPKKKKKVVPAEPPIELAEVQPKDPKARKVLVIGDFVGSGVAFGLEQAFADEPKLSVTSRANDESGLVRADFYDWNVALPELLNEEKPDLVVMAIGINDRQPLRDGKAKIAVKSAPWETTYTQRITGIVDTLKVYGRPFYWVSAPPVRQIAGSDDMSYLNGLYKPRVEAAKGHFIDIWNGFTDENGKYISSGPDVDGQPRQLRTGDGINFTKAGRLKLAFYVEREIRRTTGFGSGAVDLLAALTGANQIEIAPDGTKRLVGPVISLSDPLPGASDQLAGGDQTSAPAVESIQFKAIVKGDALNGVAGRVDDFGWPPAQRDLSFLKPAKPAAEPGTAALSEIPLPSLAN
ncbi:MAG: SGNH family hydrolase [Bauldia sp.]